MMKRLALALTLAAAFGAARPAWACPNCKEAAEAAIDSSADENEDPLAEARAYNRSIYLMIGVPYTLVGFGAFYCYRHLRHQRPDGATGQG
jgi:hypothetical protein